MNLRPLQDRVIIKRLAEVNKTAGGIIIPDSSTEKPAEGEIVAVGPGKRNNDGSFSELEVKIGDKVVFGKYAGTEIEDDLIVVKEDEILAIIG